jgi:DNA polymerase-3 subunit epsilon
MNGPLVFVDLETTGATATADRITEIGIVELSPDGVSEWSSLVNPQTRISDFIVQLTGISNAMVATAPTFAELAADVFSRLQGRVFVAHNARFDYGFLRNEFQRVGLDFRATVLCTVRLSRRLYPQYPRHNLDALIERHGLAKADRHRALGDARLIWQFWQKLQREQPAELLDQAVASLTARPSLPPHLDPALIDELPEGHGVYLFYAEGNLPLYIGKSKTLRKRVLAHFSGDHSSAREMSLSQQVRRIEWIETSGELGALLKESALIKTLMPTHNHRLRRNEEYCSWRMRAAADGVLRPELVEVGDIDFATQDDCFGLFKNRRAAL